MKSLDPNILVHMLSDAEHVLPVNMTRDKAKLIKRYRLEGDSFLSITLPTLDDLLVAGLSSGTLPTIVGWKYRNHRPEFLGPLWARVFDDGGCLLSNPCITSVRFLRQISRAYKKVFEVCAQDRVDTAVEGYVQTDRDLNLSPDLPFADVRKVFRQLFGHFVFDDLPMEGYRPQHGPGATAGRECSVSKWELRNFPPGTDLLFDPTFLSRTYSEFLHNPPTFYREPARLVAVPKTATKPRLISIEPASTQYLQQHVHAYLKDMLGRRWFSNYREQEPNQALARIGSIDGSFATLDLSEASDRVDYRLVRELFRGSPLWDYLDALRTRAVELPNGSILPLKKYASMGSALTFPIQIMVFSALAVYAMINSDPTLSVGRLVRNRLFRVYGDDIIVPTHTAGDVMNVLESYGLKVNTNKSFAQGAFRESCGADYYMGYNVTPVYIRQTNANVGTHDHRQNSAVSFRNQLYSARIYAATVAYLDSKLKSLNLSTHDCSATCVVGSLCGQEDTNVAWDSDLQVHTFRVSTLSEKRRAAKPHSSEAALRHALNNIGTEDPGFDRMIMQNRPHSMVHKVRRRPRGRVGI